MKDTLPPFMPFCQYILEEDRYPGSTVIVDLDAHSYESVPLVSWTFLNEGQRDHGLWGGILAITVICDPADADKILPHIYKQVHRWESPDKGELPDEKIGVETVTDTAVFDIVHQSIVNGKALAQFNGQFRLTIIDWS